MTGIEGFPGSSSNKRLKSSSCCFYSCTSTGMNGYNLPDELVSEILEWLPIKSIVRFSLVSKSWSALFKTPIFITNHKLKHKSGATMLLLRRHYVHDSDYIRSPDDEDDVLSFHDLNSPEIELRDPFPIRSRLRNLIGSETKMFTIQGSINGIICIFTAWRFVLCNPALRQFKLLPTTPWDAFPSSGYGRWPCEVGFGVSSSGDFKVIVSYIFRNRNPDPTYLPSSPVAHIYNSKTNSWRRFDHAPLWLNPPTQQLAVVLNGACHWPGRTFSSDRKAIVSLNLTSEVFGQLELPDCLASIHHGGFFRPVALNNCLGVLHYKQRRNDSYPIDIWVMKEYGVKESWNKLFVISPKPFVFNFMPWKDDTIFLIQMPSISNVKPTLGVEFDSEFHDQLTSINLRTSKVKKFQVFGAERNSRGLIYEESLVSLN